MSAQASAVDRAPDGGPWPLDVPRTLTLLPCGRTWLLAHLRAWPLFHGRPTHRYAGRTIVFTASDYQFLLESLPCRSASGPAKAPPSSGSSGQLKAAGSGRAPARPSQPLPKSSGRAREAELFKAAVAGLRPTVPFERAVASYKAAERRGAHQTVAVDRLASVLRGIPTRDVCQIDADRARVQLCKPDAVAATIVRHVVSPLTSVLRHASRRGWCERPNLEWPKIKQSRFTFLMPAQAENLVSNAAPHLAPIIAFMLCTGARTGEAVRLDWGDVDLRGAKATFWEDDTKTGHRRVATLPPRAIATLAALPLRQGKVFRRDDGEPFVQRELGGGVLKSAWITACRRAGLPGDLHPLQAGRSPAASRVYRPHHTPHSCRHSFATWHYAVHKDLLALRHEIGWRSTAMAERYAHVMPEGHADEVRAFWGLPISTLLAQPARIRRKLA